MTTIQLSKTSPAKKENGANLTREEKIEAIGNPARPGLRMPVRSMSCQLFLT